MKILSNFELPLLLNFDQMDIKVVISIKYGCNTNTKHRWNTIVWGCSIITLRIGGGWVSAFFVMLRDGKQGVSGTS